MTDKTEKVIALGEAKVRTFALEQKVGVGFLSFGMQKGNEGPATFFSFFGELKGEYRERIDARRQELSALLEEMFRRAVETGAIRPVEPRVAMLVFASVFNWAPHWYRPGGSMAPDELADFVFHTFMDGLTPRPAAGA